MISSGDHSIVPTLPPRRQQLHRLQFFVCLSKPRNALLALVILHVVCKSVDIGVSEFLAWLQIGRAFENDPHLLG
jgi:hypothetical protein